jgi:hypothetical protein
MYRRPEDGMKSQSSRILAPGFVHFLNKIGFATSDMKAFQKQRNRDRVGTSQTTSAALQMHDWNASPVKQT